MLDDSLSGLELAFVASMQKSRLRISAADARRFAACLLSKRFLIITGLSGSGKTRFAQAFARWITPGGLSGDPFKPGFQLRSAQNNLYTVVRADEGVIELESEDGTITPLLRLIIEEWADYIEKNHIPDSISGKELRVQIEAISKINRYLHRLESHYKPAAFALVNARKSIQAIKCYQIVPVGADWTSNESVLGYPNGLDQTAYVTKPALDLILQAAEHPDIPHFLVLDEMNLSHVERYFADILSAMESDEKITIHADRLRKAGDQIIPGEIAVPQNLFIIGTVNVDETTYMFSPKVLDRANVVEFHMDPVEFRLYLDHLNSPDLIGLDGEGTAFAKSFVKASQMSVLLSSDIKAEFNRELALFFDTLQINGAEFGYRTAYEAARYIGFYKLLGNYADSDASWFRGAFDCVIAQKMLPKLAGSRARLGPILKTLWFLCANSPADRGTDASRSAEAAAHSTDREGEPSTESGRLEKTHYKLSADKIGRMWKLLNENGFASFAEA